MIKENKIIPVLTIENSTLAVDLAKCLYDSGIRNLEITLRTKEAKKATELIINTNLDFNIGIGTVLSFDDLYFSKDIGADFALSPCTDIELIKESFKIDFKFIPGVSTSTDINTAIKLGCKTLKLFPTIQLGGLNYFRSIYSPYKSSELNFIALGGINDKNANVYVKNECFIGVGASWIATNELINNKDWKEINRRAKILLSL
jgi:2-dehydro-3-deoxyphosphogluconate aldolase/(4S)-4-hydroxy-2-oxoglutarate aldolase